MNKVVATMACLALGGCQGSTSQTANSQREQQPATASPSVAPPAPRAAEVVPRASAAGSSNRRSLPEPKRPIDPKSVEAAGQIVQHFGALIESGRTSEAEALWGDAGMAAKFVKQLPTATHLEIGDLGSTEGAAGSIYTTVPATFYGPGYRKPASIILRRVNDVPGSTAAQRRWHIERIDWQ